MIFIWDFIFIHKRLSLDVVSLHYPTLPCRYLSYWGWIHQKYTRYTRSKQKVKYRNVSSTIHPATKGTLRKHFHCWVMTHQQRRYIINLLHLHYYIDFFNSFFFIPTFYHEHVPFNNTFCIYHYAMVTQHILTNNYNSQKHNHVTNIHCTHSFP